MLITPSNLDFIFKGVTKSFEQAYYTTPADLTEKVAARVPSGTRDQFYPFTALLSGAMTQWVGERKMQNIVLDDFSITNLLWENSLSIRRVDIEDDQYGIYSSMLAPNLARHAKMLPDVQIARVFNENFTGFDSKALFATDHPTDPSGQNSGTQSNAVTGKPLNATNLNLAQAAMMNFKGPDNLPMGCYGATLLVPPSLDYVGRTLANAAFFPEAKNAVSGTFGSQTNIFQGSLSVVTSPYLTDSGDPATAVWYLLDTRSEMRVALWQDRESPQLISLVDPANPYTFFQDKYAMGVRMRGAAGAGLWFKGYKSSGA